MDERLRFVARLLEDEKMAVLCREFGIVDLQPILIQFHQRTAHPVDPPGLRKAAPFRMLGFIRSGQNLLQTLGQLSAQIDRLIAKTQCRTCRQ